MPKSNKLQRLAIADKAREILRRRSGRRALLDRCGEKAFLKPDELKFPIVNPLSKDCKPDCKMIHAAYVRAKEWHYNDIASKAAALYKSNNCEKELGIKMESE
jgi:hypothetical protein